MSEKQKENLENAEEITLESILAEYKGEAFIDGQKKTPKETLDEMTQQILDETLGRLPKVSEEAFKTPESPPEPSLTADVQDPEPHQAISTPEPPVESHFGLDGIESPPEDEATVSFPAVAVPEPPPVPEAEPDPVTVPAPSIESAEELDRGAEPEKTVRKWEAGEVIQIPFSRPEQPASGEPDEPPIEEPMLDQWHKAEGHQEVQSEEAEFSDSDPKVSDYTAYANPDKMEAYAELYDETEDEEKRSLFGSLLGRFGRKSDGNDTEEELSKSEKSPQKADDDEPEGRYDDAAFAQDDMTLREAAGRYSKGIDRYQMRGILAILLSLIMLLFTALGQGETNLPGIMGSAPGLTAVMLVAFFVVLFLTADVLAIGVMDIVRRRLGAESLVTIAGVASIISAVMIIRTGDVSRGLPYFPVVAFALGTALLGIKATRNAMKNTLRTAAKGVNSAVMFSKFDKEDETFVLFKSKTDTDGFLGKTQQMDFSEYAYTMAAPLLLAMSAVFALLAALGGAGEIGHFVQNFAAMTAVSATFTGLLAYGLPYSLLARKLMKAGAALAGWGGAVEADEATGVIVTDTDVFPAGTLSLAGVRILHEPDTQRVISYTASLIVESRCGLADLFAEVVRKHKYTFYPVADLSTYEGGGIEATVNGEQVSVGSASFMNLMGIRLDQNLNVKNAVFTAIGGELVGVFAIDYMPQTAVQEALESLLHTKKVQPLFAVRDFNITPLMIQSKFNISMEKIDFLTYAERFALSGMTPDERGRPIAVLNREGLGPLTDVVVGGKRLRRTVMLNTILSMGSSVIGLLLLLWFFWAGIPESASVSNVFFYLAAWLVVISLSSRAVTFD